MFTHITEEHQAFLPSWKWRQHVSLKISINNGQTIWHRMSSDRNHQNHLCREKRTFQGITDKIREVNKIWGRSILLNIYWILNYSNPKNSSSDSILLLLLLAMHVLLKNFSIPCLYFLSLPLVDVCAWCIALYIHQKEWWKCWGARYLSKKYLLNPICCQAGVFWTNLHFW
jgi:hypothetical protein